MALTTNQLLGYSCMSQASYLDFTGLVVGTSGDALKDRLIQSGLINEAKILAETQAQSFTAS
ncbi:MAG: hypothetical protein PHI11_04535 [Gallionella sp.]|nr:hypothetical protein [Gallionella sp.]